MAEKKKDPAKVKILHLGHFSLRIFNNAQQAESDIRRYLATDPTVASFTEITGKPRMDLFTRVCKDMGYRPVTYNAPNADGAFAIKDGEATLKDREMVAGTKTKSEGSGKVFNNYIQVICVKWQGLDLWFHTSHWPGHMDTMPENARAHDELTRRMAQMMIAHAKGPNAVSFWCGDTNVEDKASGFQRGTNFAKITREAGMISIWDELKRFPGTHAGGRTIDVVGSLARDSRVKGKRAQMGPKMNSDHRPVYAWYEVNVAAKPGPGSGNGGGSTPTPGDQSGNNADDDIYATGGNVSWKDYQDKEIYPLQAAVDDTDTTNG